MRVIRIAIAVALGSGLAVAACSSFSEEDGSAPDAGPTEAGGADGNEDASVDRATPPDAPIDGARSAIGCSDGTVEDYANAPLIAACAGGWSTPGLIAPAGGTVPVTCAREAGNSGNNQKGAGCSAGDLCAVGWHVCTDHVDVTGSLPPGDAGGPCELARNSEGAQFYATAQPSSGAAVCDSDASATNDVLGCGDLLTQPDTQSCGPLNALLSVEHQVSGWSVVGASTERTTVQHAGVAGGVLCCAD